MNSNEVKACKIHIGSAKCGVDLSDGSERGEYVGQDYILHKLGRPHRYINLMYCYYPLDKEWPKRASTISDTKTGYSWDYAYDDYFPYQGGLNGNTQGEPFSCMRDIRSHGQDVKLTLTIDCSVSDDHLRQIASDLKPFGRLQLRINHEATGDWFAFNKRYTYQEVADFFVRFHNIIKQEAPNIKTVICIGGIGDLTKEEIAFEKEFAETIRVADVWSMDKYLALNWMWPKVIAEKNGPTHMLTTKEFVFEQLRRTFERYRYLSGKEKPLVLSELNVDGDVVGLVDQANIIREFYFSIKNNGYSWLKGVTFYQFRDRGRLGLEMEDPGNCEIGIEQPVLQAYKEICHDPYFMPDFKTGESIALPVTLRWGGFEDADGIAIPITMEKDPVFFEVIFEEVHLNIMMEINGRWFYKKPGVKRLDLMPAFFSKSIAENSTLTFKMFAVPPNGENDPSQGEDWAINYYTLVETLPAFRIRYEPVATGTYSPSP